MSYTFENDISELLVRIKDEIEIDNVIRLKSGISKSVKRIQEWLCLHSFPVVIDGNFGPITELAVKSFQDYAGTTPDGVVGKKTYAKLVKPMIPTLWGPISLTVLFSKRGIFVDFLTRLAESHLKFDLFTCS